MVIADVIDQGWERGRGRREIRGLPDNYKQPFPETFSGEIYHSLTRPGITQEIIAAFRI
jgi:hypothetical protein